MQHRTSDLKRARKMAWRLPLDPRDSVDLKDINFRLERLRHIQGILLKLRAAIMARARNRYKLQRGWQHVPGRDGLVPPGNIPAPYKNSCKSKLHSPT